MIFDEIFKSKNEQLFSATYSEGSIRTQLEPYIHALPPPHKKQLIAFIDAIKDELEKDAGNKKQPR